MFTASSIKHFSIEATDGVIGSISDFLFDDRSWRVRWVVVDTGQWLPERKVLLTPRQMSGAVDEKRHFRVDLTKQQVEKSPDIAAEQPVSRQIESAIFEHYGLDPYWRAVYNPVGVVAMPGVVGVPPLSPPVTEAKTAEKFTRGEGDPDLRSMNVVTGYRIRARDGEIGHVDDFVVDDTEWTIPFLVVDTRNWWPGQKALVPASMARDIAWSNRLVYLRLSRSQIRAGPTYDPTRPLSATLPDRDTRRRTARAR